MIDTQDFIKGIDILALTSVSGSELNQLVDVARFSGNKGGIIETTDTAANVPEIPDPNGDYLGILPIWWKRYIWRRLAFEGEDTEVLNYVWDESIDEGDLLFWSLIDKNGRDALEIANTALTNANAAQNTANTAQTNAENAQTSADAAQTTADTAITATEANASALNVVTEFLDSLWSSGDLKYTCKATLYSTTENQGWLECDGTAIDRVVFADLFVQIGTTWGIGDGTTTFNVPDFRGRTLIGIGTATGGVIPRTLGQQTIGEETHLLTGVESGIAAHSHNAAKVIADSTTGGDNKFVDVVSVSGALVATSTTGPTNAAQAHNIVQPSAVARIIIKT